MVFEAADNILRLLNITSYVNNLGLKVFINVFHIFPFVSCAISLLFFVMSGKLIFFNELQKLDVVTL